MEKIKKSPEQGKAVDTFVSLPMKRRSSKSPFSRVNEKYGHLLESQVVKKDLGLKRLVIDKCITRIPGIIG